MERSVGILLMVTFGISGVLAAALAWLYPALGIDKGAATLTGLIGVGFAIIQGFRFRHARPDDGEAISVEVADPDKP